MLAAGCAGIGGTGRGDHRSPEAEAVRMSVLWDPGGRFLVLDADGGRRLEQRGEALVLTGRAASCAVSLQPLVRPMYLAGYGEVWQRVAAERYLRENPGAALVDFEVIRSGGIDALRQGFNRPGPGGTPAAATQLVTVPAGRVLLRAECDGAAALEEARLLAGGLALVPDVLADRERRALPGSAAGEAFAAAQAAAARGQAAVAGELLADARKGSRGDPLLDFAHARFLALTRRDCAQSVRLLERLARERPESRDVRYNLAVVKGLQGDLEGAIGEYRSYLLLEPQDVETLNNLAVLCARSGRRDDALRALEGAREVSEVYAPTFYHLGQLLRETDPRAAAAALRTFLEKDPESDLAPAVRELVARLEKEGGL
jgi:tetratricopeptide (TPR) repeat protein